MADRLIETIAATYAEAVYRLLVADFPNLQTRTLELLVLEQVARQTEAPSPAFEIILDDPSVANWRLVPDPTGGTRWRVQVACCKPHPSHANAQREQRLNAALRAIQPWKMLSTTPNGPCTSRTWCGSADQRNVWLYRFRSWWFRHACTHRTVAHQDQ